MKIPLSGNDVPKKVSEYPEKDEAYIINPYFGQQYLTLDEALDLLNIVTWEMIIDGEQRSKSS